MVNTITGELPTTPNKSFKQFSKVCSEHGVLDAKHHKYGCLITGKTCNKYDCPKYEKKDNVGKKKDKHPFLVSRRYRSIV